MKTCFPLVVAFALFGSAFSALAATETYQVTGPVMELTDSKIVIQKDKEKWEVERTADTKVTGELKVGSKVTVFYTMTASKVEAKPEKTAPTKPAAAPTKPAKKP